MCLLRRTVLEFIEWPSYILTKSFKNRFLPSADFPTQFSFARWESYDRLSQPHSNLALSPAMNECKLSVSEIHIMSCIVADKCQKYTHQIYNVAYFSSKTMGMLWIWATYSYNTTLWIPAYYPNILITHITGSPIHLSHMG